MTIKEQMADLTRAVARIKASDAWIALEKAAQNPDFQQFGAAIQKAHEQLNAELKKPQLKFSDFAPRQKARTIGYLASW